MLLNHTIEITPAYDGHRFRTSTFLFNKCESDWDKHLEFLTPTREMRIEYGGYIIRAGTHVILVDTGMGPDPTDQREMAEGGRLLESLNAMGIQASDVTHVLFTHLHFDHIGWATVDERVVFRNALYMCDERDREWFFDVPNPGEAPDNHRRADAVRKLAPLGDRLQTWTEGGPLLPGVDVIRAPGHTPGSAAFMLSSGDERALLLGDAIHTPVQLTEDNWEMLYDIDRREASRFRKKVVEDLERYPATLVGAAHFPGHALGRLTRLSDRRVWTFV